MSLIQPSVLHRKWEKAPSDVVLEPATVYRRHTEVKPREAKHVAVRPPAVILPLNVIQNTSAYKHLARANRVKKVPEKMDLSTEEKAPKKKKPEKNAADIIAEIVKLKTVAPNTIEALGLLSQSEQTDQVANLLESIKQVYTVLDLLTVERGVDAAKKALLNPNYPDFVGLIGVNQRHVREQLDALVHKIATPDAKFKRQMGAAQKILALVSSFADSALKFPADAYNAKAQITGWMAQASDGLLKNSKKKNLEMEKIGAEVKATVDKQVAQYARASPRIKQVANTVDTEDNPSFYADIETNFGKYDACLPYFLPSDHNDAILQFASNPKKFGEQLKRLVNNYVRSRYNAIGLTGRQQLPVCSRIMSNNATLSDLTTCMKAIDELASSDVTLAQQKKPVKAPVKKLPKVIKQVKSPAKDIEPAKSLELDDYLGELEAELESASPLQEPNRPESVYEEPVQEPVELSEESIEELSEESSEEPVQEPLEEPKDEIQDISEESVDEIKEPLEEAVEEEPIDKIVQEPVQEPVDEIQKPAQISKPADPMQKALEDLVVYAQNPRTKNRKAAIESIKAQDASLVPRVERFYQAIDEYNKQDVKPTNIKRFVDKLSDSPNMSSVDRSVLVADLQRALQLTDTENSPSPQTPPPSPKKVKTPPASPKKVPASPKKLQTPPASPKKVPESPKRVPSPEAIAPVPDETPEDDVVWFGLEPDRPRVKAAGPPVLSQDLKTAYTSKIGTPVNWDSLAVVPVVLRLRRAYAVLDYANQFNGSSVGELIEYAKLNAKLAKTRAELSAMSPDVQTALARDLQHVLPLYMPQPAVTEDDSSSSSDEDQVAGRVTRHDLILKLVTELAKKFKTRAEWLPIIQQIKAKPSLVPLKALYPANMRKKAARDLKLLDNQLRETPLLIYLSLIDRVGHADFEQALASHSKTRT